MDRSFPNRLLPERGGPPLLAAVAALGLSGVMAQLSLLREAMSAFSGNEMVLGIVLGWWLLLMGCGAWLGRYATRFSLRVWVAAQGLVAILPLGQVVLLRTLRNVVLVRGAAVGVGEVVLAVGLLLLPYCLISGYALTLASSLMAERAGSAGISQVYVADSLGGIIGGMLFSFVLCRFLDHLALLAIPGALNLLAAAGIAFQDRRAKLAGGCIALSIAIPVTVWLVDLDGWSTALQYRPLHILAKANSPYGRLLVTEETGQVTLFENGVPLSATRDDQHVEETVHFAMAQRPQARKVLLVGGGFSGTAREILRYHPDRVDYVELDPALLALGAKYLPQNLAGNRIEVRNTDGRLFIKLAQETYDVVILDLPPPATAQFNRFYTAEFFQEIHRVLAPDGALLFALGQYENFISPALSRLLASARASVACAFRNVLVLPGSQVFFLASDGPLFQDIAARLEARQLKTRWIQRNYLAAMFTPDRIAEVERAVRQPAALNQDFNPTLYYYHWRYWLSQFDTNLSVGVALLFLLPAAYLLRLRGASVALLASGFAASALEMVLLMAFQVICGSVYHQVGVIVTMFMAGLALGAWLVNRHGDSDAGRRGAPVRPDGGGVETKPGEPLQPRMALAFLALGIALYAAALPLVLPQLAHLGAARFALAMTQALIGLLALALAVLVGMQFPLASRWEYDGTARGPSRLYTADFVGAFAGALLAGALLMPVLGVMGVCWLTMGLNLLAGVVVICQKVVR